MNTNFNLKLQPDFMDSTYELTKNYINTTIKNGSKALLQLLNNYKNQHGSIIFILKNIGHLPKDFDCNIFTAFFSHENSTVRCLAVKNIGKSNSKEYLTPLCKLFNIEKSSFVKREIISSIGRMRTVDAVPFLLDALQDKDPKIIAQAVRALLVFKGTSSVDETLANLINHENEMIRTAIYKEYFSNQKNNDILPHAETYNFLKNVVVLADVRDVLAKVPNESIHLTFTSPPYYNARDYSIYPSYEAYLNFLEEVFLEIHRTTKEGRYLIVNTSPVIVPRISRAHSSKRYPIPFDLHHRLSNIGWEFIDDIVWMKPEYSVKNRIGGFQQHRKPLAYKPNSITEYLMVYRKNTSKLIDWNIKQYSSVTVEESKVKNDFETTNVWQICPRSDKVHSAVFPEELCKRVIEYYSFKGDLVFDPFAGSGTLGRTAKKMKRYFFLTEKEEKYFEYMKSLKSNNISDSEMQTTFLTFNEFKETIR